MMLGILVRIVLANFAEKKRAKIVNMLNLNAIKSDIESEVIKMYCPKCKADCFMVRFIRMKLFVMCGGCMYILSKTETRDWLASIVKRSRFQI